MTEISRKLTELGYHTFSKMHQTIDEPPSAELRRLGVDLPDDYAAFLAEFPEAGVFDREVGFRGLKPTPWEGRDGVAILEMLYGRCDRYKSRDVISVRDQYLDEFGASYLAIGEVTGANQVCLCCAGKNKGRIYVWDHEHFGRPAGAFYPAFDDFTSFIDGLFEYEAPANNSKHQQPPDERIHYGINLRLWLRDRFGKDKT